MIQLQFSDKLFPYRLNWYGDSIFIYETYDDAINNDLSKAVGRRCNVCHTLKLKEEFKSEKRTKSGMSSVCKDCYNSWQSEYYRKRNKEE